MCFIYTNASQTQKLNSALLFSSRLLFTDLVGQRADDDAQVGQGAVDGSHLFEALTLRLTLQHSLAASQVHQTQSGYMHTNKQGHKNLCLQLNYTKCIQVLELTLMWSQ